MSCCTSAPRMESAPWAMALRYLAITDTKYGVGLKYFLEIRDTLALQVVVAGAKTG